MPVKVQTTISRPTLDRIEADARWAAAPSTSDPASVVSRFSRDHGNLLVYSKNGVCDLYAEHNGSILRSRASMIARHASPTLMTELVRGYRRALDAGLLDASQPNPDAPDYLPSMAKG